MKQYETLLYQWAINENRGYTVENYLLNHGVRRVLVYGAGVIGELLFQVLKESKIQVAGFIDQNKGQLLEELHGIPITTLEQIDFKCDFDIVVVTIGHLYYEVVDRIKSFNEEIKTISIEAIVFGMMRGDE